MKSLEDWLRANDERLLLDRASVGEAARRAQQAIGDHVCHEIIEAAASRVCLFWRRFQIRRISRATALNEKQWWAVRSWLKAHLEAVGKAKDLQTIALMMAADGVPCNEFLLSNSESFAECKREAMKGELCKQS